MKQNKGDPNFTYTSYLQKIKKRQVQQLQKYTYGTVYPLKSLTSLNQMKVSLKNKQRQLPMPLQLEPLPTSTPSKSKIDQNASIINGRLIYLQQDIPTVDKHNKQLLRLLKDNQIRYKDYVLGNKQTCFRLIQKHLQQQEQQVIQAYINRHIKMQKATKIQLSQDYYLSKQRFIGNQQ